jgi:uncharacterized RDD family membrane protein YckC
VELRTPIRPASIGRRLGAAIYDALLLTALALIGGFALLPLLSPGVPGASLPTVPPVFIRTLTFCALVAGGAAYCVGFWSDGRRTLAQKTWRLKLVDGAGHPPSRRTALIRYAAAWIGPLAAIIGYAAVRPTGFGRFALVLLAINYAWAFVDRDRQFLHDRVAGTRVVLDAASPGSHSPQ